MTPLREGTIEEERGAQAAQVTKIPGRGCRKRAPSRSSKTVEPEDVVVVGGIRRLVCDAAQNVL